MNIEELKLVFETVATVTDDAKSVAIWYLVFNYGASFVLKLTGMIGFGWLVLVIARAILSTSEWARIGAKVAGAWGHWSYSIYSNPNDEFCLKAIDDCITAAKEHKK